MRCETEYIANITSSMNSIIDEVLKYFERCLYDRRVEQQAKTNLNGKLKSAWRKRKNTPIFFIYFYNRPRYNHPWTSQKLSALLTWLSFFSYVAPLFLGETK